MLTFSILKDILPEELCRSIINTIRDSDYIEVGDGVYDHLRYDFNDTTVKYKCLRNISKYILNRVKDYIPQKLKNYYICPEFYVSKYTDKCALDEHIDGTNNYNGDSSIYTILFYLNDDFKGGNTVTLDSDLNIIDVIKPETWKCLILNQNVLHMAQVVNGNNAKYIMRSDIMLQ